MNLAIKLYKYNNITIGDNMTLTREELNEELEKVNKEIETLNNNLIKVLTDVGIEHIDLYSYINSFNNLEVRENKIQYLLATKLE